MKIFDSDRYNEQDQLHESLFMQCLHDGIVLKELLTVPLAMRKSAHVHFKKLADTAFPHEKSGYFGVADVEVFGEIIKALRATKKGPNG